MATITAGPTISTINHDYYEYYDYYDFTMIFFPFQAIFPCPSSNRLSSIIVLNLTYSQGVLYFAILAAKLAEVSLL